MRAISLVERAEGHAAPITHVALSHDGKMLATSSYDGSVIIWSPESSTTPGARIHHRRLVNAASWSPHAAGLLATASADKTVGLWQVSEDGREAQARGRLARHTDDVNAVAWLPDGERLVTASEDSTALIWELATGRFLGKFAAHSGHCMAIAVSPDGHVLTVGEDGLIVIGDLDHPSDRHERNFTTSIEGCAFNHDGSKIALAGDDGFVRILSPELDLLAEVLVSKSAARAVAFADDRSGRLVVGSYDASVRLLDGERVTACATGDRLWPRSVATSGDQVVVGSFGARPIRLTLDELAWIDNGAPSTNGPNALATKDGSLAVGLDSGVVFTTPLATLHGSAPAIEMFTEVGKDPVLSLTATPRGWVVGSYTGQITALSREGEIESRLALPAPITSLATLSDGDLLLAGTYAGTVTQLQVREGLVAVETEQRHEGSIKSIAALPRGAAITGATDGRVQLLGSDGAVEVLWHHGNLINAVSADERGVVASASRDRLARVGLTSKTFLPIDLLGADESMKAVCVLGCGRIVWILAGSYDFAIYTWRIDLDHLEETGARSGSVIAATGQGISTMLRIDASRCVVASWDGTLRMIELIDDELHLHPPVAISTLLAAATTSGKALIDVA